MSHPKWNVDLNKCRTLSSGKRRKKNSKTSFANDFTQQENDLLYWIIDVAYSGDRNVSHHNRRTIRESVCKADQ